MLVPINLTGGDYEADAPLLSNQITKNFWPKKIGTQKAESQYVLQSFYGLLPWATANVPAGLGRGLFVNQGTLYRVVGNSLCSVASNGNHTVLGNIPGTGRCIFDAVEAQLTTITNRAAYNLLSNVVTQITDPNIGTPQACTSINNQMIYDSNGDVSQTWNVSNVGDPTTINGLNNAQAESTSSPLRRPYTYKQVVNMFKSDKIELWWDSGQGNPPFDRIQGGLADIGLNALYSVAQSGDPTSYMFFFGSDKQVHAMTGGTGGIDSVVSTPAMAKIFQKYAITSDAIGWCMELEGLWFYVITFPTQNITWCYPIGGEWFQWGSGLIGRIQANGYVQAYDLNIADDYASNKLFLLDAGTYTDNGNPIIRERVCAPIHGGLFQAPGKAFEIQGLELIAQVGTGLISGQGSLPKIGVSMSRDGGLTFGTERLLNVGAMGQYVKVETGSFGRFKRSCVIKLRVSDPTFVSIFSAAAQIDVCI